MSKSRNPATKSQISGIVIVLFPLPNNLFRRLTQSVCTSLPLPGAPHYIPYPFDRVPSPIVRKILVILLFSNLSP